MQVPTPYPRLTPEALDKAYETGRVRGWGVVKTKQGASFLERSMALELYEAMAAESNKRTPNVG